MKLVWQRIEDELNVEIQNHLDEAAQWFRIPQNIKVKDGKVFVPKLGTAA